MSIVDEGIEMVTSIAVTVVVGGCSIWIISLASYFPRNIGVPIAQVLVFVLLCIWYLYFINNEMWLVEARPTCQGCSPEIDDPDVYYCDVCNLMPDIPAPKAKLPWSHRRAGGREFRDV